ncbi:MAG: alpha/beta fold hydrolase [Hyphomonadaceae bacterium]|jgi:polyhydroxyalkanoate synthase|nr:alpha/beta fold hydrolase [Hyphomonadaceae bacterium]
MSPAGTQDEASLAAQVQKEVERAIQRNIKGVDFLFASSVPPVGLTPKDVIHSRGTLSLYHYRPMADEIYRVPLLIVMATSNKGYIVDLAPGQSFIEFLLKQGYDVYMIDWSAPRADERRLRLEDYTLDFIPDCVRRVQQRSGVEDVNMIGYCMGGVLSTIYAALHVDGPVKHLVCFTTPIDWRQMPLFQAWSDRRYFDVDRLVDAVGNVPADFVLSAFDMLRPAGRVAGQIRMWDNMWNDEFVKSYRMFERWGAETLPLAGEYFRQTTKELLWDNKLCRNELVVGGRRVDLRAITVPVLHVVAEHDHIVPYAAAKPLIAGVGSAEKEEVMLKGGHVSLVAGPNAVKRLWPKLDAWLGVRST